MGTESSRTLDLFLVQTIEQACALTPVPGAAQPAVPAGGFAELIAADFSGPMSGRVLFGLSGDLAARFARGFLDGEKPLDRGEQLDALKEMANILCGNLLPYVGGSRAVFKIAVPRRLASDEWRQKPGERLFGETSAAYDGGNIFLRVLVVDSL